MIPWFIVSLIDNLAWLFGRQTYVNATSGNWWGAERIHLARRIPGEPRPRRLKAYRGGPLQPGSLLTDAGPIGLTPAPTADLSAMIATGPSTPLLHRG